MAHKCRNAMRAAPRCNYAGRAGRAPGVVHTDSRATAPRCVTSALVGAGTLFRSNSACFRGCTLIEQVEDGHAAWAHDGFVNVLAHRLTHRFGGRLIGQREMVTWVTVGVMRVRIKISLLAFYFRHHPISKTELRSDLWKVLNYKVVPIDPLK